MHITADRGALLRALQPLARIVEKKGSIPILANVLLDANNDGDRPSDANNDCDRPASLRLQTTDIFLSANGFISCEIEEPGSTTLPVATLLDIVKKSPLKSMITIISIGDQSTVSVGRSKFKLQTLPASDFPDAESSVFATGKPAVATFTTSARDLHRLLDRVSFAASVDETRYYLNGVYLDLNGSGYLRSCATDGHRLARSGIPAPEGSSSMPGIIVPSRAVAEFLKLLDVAGDAEITITDVKISVRAGDFSVTSKLIDGTYPDVDRVIPKQNPVAVIVRPKALGEAVDRVSTVAAKRGTGLKVVFAGGVATITMSSPDNGVAVDEIDVDVTMDDPDTAIPEMGFNASYLSGLASHLLGEEATIRLFEPGSPALITDGGDASSIYVLMPMRV